MRILLAALVALSISAPGMAGSQQHEEWLQQRDEWHQKMIPFAAWLLEQPSLQRRATGLLLVRQIEVSPFASPEPSRNLLEEITDLLAQHPEPATLTLLAAICRQADIQDACVERGLAEAVIAHDNGNAFSLAQLFPKDSESLREALLLSHAADDHFFEFAEIWMDATIAYHGDRGVDLDTIWLEEHPPAQGVAMASGFMMSYSVLLDTCRHESSESALAEACERIGAQAAGESNSQMSRMIGFAMLKDRAVASNEEARVAQIRADVEALSSRFHCLQKGIPQSHWEHDKEFAIEFVRDAARLGEFVALQRRAAEVGVHCS